MWNKTEFKIAQHFACALLYGDYGDMSFAEAQEFHAWRHNEQDGKQGHWSIDSHPCEDYGKCEVTGLFSNLTLVSWNYKG